jgi:hypothetical protein
MPRRLKPYALLILTILIIVFLVGPPLAIASNLPTACNIFHKKMVDKAGCCGHRAVSKIQDNSFNSPAVLLLSVNFEISYFLMVPNNFPSLTYLFMSDSQLTPLRC